MTQNINSDAPTTRTVNGLVEPTVGMHGQVVIRRRFTQFTGKFARHCHILAHEDAAIMGQIEMSVPGDGPPPA